MRDEYILRVQYGNELEKSTWKIMNVNDENALHYVNNPFFEGYLKVRLQNYDGLPVNTTDKETLIPTTPYFEASQDRFSIEINGIFKGYNDSQGWPISDILFGNQFDAPLKLPTLVNAATKFATWFDPGLKIDLAAEKPWAFSLFLVAVNRLSVTRFDGKEEELKPIKVTQGKAVEECSEGLTGLIREEGESNEKFAKRRQNHLAKKESSKNVYITKDQLIRADFFNPYLDFNQRGITIPLFTIPIMKYWDGQDLTYICKSEKEGVIFFIVSFQLVEIKSAFNEIIQNDELD